MALELQIEPLLTYLTFADKGKKGVEEDMKYHKTCSTALFNKHVQMQNRTGTLSDTSKEAARAFCNLIQYIVAQVEDGVYNFKLPMLANLHQGFREALCIQTRMNGPIFKEKLTNYFKSESSWIMHDEKSLSLCFHSALKNTAITADEQFKVIANCAKILRSSILNHRDQYDFATKQFLEGAQENSVPHELKALLGLMLYPGTGPDGTVDTQAMLTIAQLVMINFKKTTPSSATSSTRRSLAQDTPLPLYVSLYVYNESKSMKIVKKLYDLGIGVHPNRVSDTVDDVAGALCEAYRLAGDVVHPMLVPRRFVLFHADNIDWQTSSTHSTGDLHGTALTALQGHFNPVFPPRIPTQYPASVNRELKLPLHYTTVDFFSADIKNLKFNSTDRGIEMIPHDDAAHMLKALADQRLWVLNAELFLLGKPVDKHSAVSWPTFHADLSEKREIYTAAERATKMLLPVRPEPFATVSNIAHVLKNVLRITSKVNPGQIAFIAFDQPPFTLARSLQIKYPLLFGRDRLFIDFGALHIEMNLQLMLGQLLKLSGWVEMLKKTGIYSADSCLGHTNVMRTRNAITVSVCALSMLQNDAFMETREQDEPFSLEAFLSWITTQLKFPNFQFWDLILRTQNLVLIMVSAVRNRNADLYIATLEKLIPFMFILDHQNYARWLSIFVNDLRTQTPAFRLEYEKNFSVYLIPASFTAQPPDQLGEGSIKEFKSEGGQSYLTQNPHALLRNNISAGAIKHMMDTGLHLANNNPDIERDENNDEASEEHGAGPKNPHHSKGKASQLRFINQVQEMKTAFLEHGNVFANKSADLIVLDTAEVMPPSVASSYATMEQKGIAQYESFKLNRILLGKIPIDEPIKRNKPPLFSHVPTAVIPKDEMTIIHLKNDAFLFSRALTAKGDGREVSVEELLKFEHRMYPPSLAQYNGQLRKPTKSDILPILLGIEGDIAPMKVPDHISARILDGPAIVHMLKVTSLKPVTFKDYFVTVFNPYLEQKLERSQELFIAFDVYKENSLKAGERRRRGAGRLYHVGPQTPVPNDWFDFLRNDQNKEGLFLFLADCIIAFQYPVGKRVYVSKGNQTLHSAGVEDSNVDGGVGFLGTNHDHEEADTLMLLYAGSAVNRGASSIEIRSVDSDTVIIALCIFSVLLAINNDVNLWVTLGTGTKITSYHINAIFANLETEMGPDTAFALAFFTTFTGCDTVSYFFGKGKVTCFQAWRLQSERITREIIRALRGPFMPLTVSSDAFKCAEILAISFYDRNSEDITVNAARVTMANQKKFDFELMPPTQGALLEHANRAFYQARVWVQCLMSIQNLPSPSDYGWTNVKGCWEILWSKEAMTCKDLTVLVSCKCKKEGGCKGGNCKCVKHGLPCTTLCSCTCDEDSDPIP